MATPERDSNGRFSRRGEEDLFEIVREVTLLAIRPGADPRKVRQEAWCAAVPKSDWPEAARPDEICRQLGRGWRELLSEIFSGKSLEHVERRRRAAVPEPLVSDERIYHSLRRVAVATGNATLSEADYALGYKEIGARQGRKRGGANGNSLLTLDQIKNACDDDWQRALQIAELEPLEKKSPIPEGKAITLVETVELFLAETGEWPTLEELRPFARAKGRELTKPRSEKLSEAVEAVRAARVAAGESAPPWEPKRKRKRAVSWSVDVEADEADDEQPGIEVRVVRALREFLEVCKNRKPRAKPTLRFYKQLQSQPQYKHWPAGSAMQRRGSWPEQLKAARTKDALEQAQAADAAALAVRKNSAAQPQTRPTEYSADDPRAIEILEYLRQLGEPAGNKAIRSNCGGLSKTTATRLLAALVRAGEVDYRGGGQGRVYFIPTEEEREAA